MGQMLSRAQTATLQLRDGTFLRCVACHVQAGDRRLMGGCQVPENEPPAMIDIKVTTEVEDEEALQIGRAHV